MPRSLSLLRYRWTLFYVLLIPIVNWGFVHVPVFSLPDGGVWPPMTIATGLILVLRDFSQRELGHYVLVPLVVGIILSFAMAQPEIALASALAFAVSEMVDWMVFSLSTRSFAYRVLASSAFAAPADTILFWTLANYSTPVPISYGTIALAIITKWLVAVAVYLYLRRAETRR